MEEERKVYKVLVGKPEGKRPLGRPGRRWENGIRMGLMDIVWGCGVDSTGSGLGQVAGCCECDDEPLGSDVTELGFENEALKKLHSSMAYYIHVCLYNAVKHISLH
jgi:hypothetical protein